MQDFNVELFNLTEEEVICGINIKRIDKNLRKAIDENISYIWDGESGEIGIAKKEILKFLNNKNSNEKKYGAIAEFFIHLYLRLNNYQQVSLFQNLEENSYKKGFDGYYIKNAEEWIIDKIYVLFINNIESILNYEVLRLKYKETRNYYKKFLNDCKKGINENIQEQFAYFKSIQHNPLRNKFYIGESYGEIIKQTENYSGFAKKVYVDLREKNDFQLINLAIVKIKMEEDFVNYKIKSFLELMLKVELIDEEEYNFIIYGTNDVKKLELIKKGIAINIVNKLDEDNQIKNLTFDINNNLQSNLEFDKYKNNLDDFLQFELNKYL